VTRRTQQAKKKDRAKKNDFQRDANPKTKTQKKRIKRKNTRLSSGSSNPKIKEALRRQKVTNIYRRSEET